MQPIKVTIINNVSGKEEHRFYVKIDRTSDGYLRQLIITNNHITTTSPDILSVADNEYVLGLIRPMPGCQVVVG